MVKVEFIDSVMPAIYKLTPTPILPFDLKI